MTKKKLRELLKLYKTGKIPEEKLISLLSQPASEYLSSATLDLHRELRKGYPEVIYCEYKTPAQVAEIAAAIVGKNHLLLATRATKDHYTFVKKKVKEAVYHKTSRTITLNKFPDPSRPGQVLIVTAGTSDLPVAEEARITLKCLGSRVKLICDVGVAGIHRLLEVTEELHAASVIIVVAGMEGALPSVVGGMVDAPVIAVPTSVGYGTGFGGIAALLSMLNSCSSGVTVVNIDNGFGAAFAAHLMNR